MENKKIIYVFLGLPASGKGTQAKILAKKLGIKMISAGDLIREIMASDESDPFVADIKKRYEAGIPQPDEVVIDLFQKFLQNSSTSIILDNFPFSVGQAQFLDKFLDENSDWDSLKIFNIKVDPENTIKRAISRKICTSCGAIYGHISEMICEKCGGSLVVRSDDNEETMRKRIEQYFPRLNELLDFYKDRQTKVIQINGEGTIEEVSAEIDKYI